MKDAPENKEHMGQEQNSSSFNAKEQAKNMMDDVKGMGNVKPGDFMPGKTKGMPTSLKVMQVLLILGAIGSILSGGVFGIIGAVLALVAVWGINKRVMWAYYLLIAFIIYSVAVTLLTVWVGYSFVSLAIDAILLYYVVKSRHWFVEKK